MSEKKMVRRSVAVALGIICVLLIASIAYLSMASISTQNNYNNLQNQNMQLQTWLDGNETLLHQTQVDNTNLTNQVNDLTNALNLNKSTVWVNNQTVVSNQTGPLWPPVYAEFWSFTADYAGYVLVQVFVHNSTFNPTIEVIYSSHGVDYYGTATGTGAFPVLPSDIVIAVSTFGPGELYGMYETATITYYY